MEKRIWRIVFTGGPCGGKTTILSFLQQKLTDLGFTVIIISETATEFITAGITPAKLGSFAFQRLLLRHQITKEDMSHEAARMMPDEKVVEFFDRGTADVEAYVEEQAFDLLLSEFGDLVQLRDIRYDAVMCLRSVAVDRPEIYTLANNKARTESVLQAKALDERTIKAWTGHPHVRVIGNEDDITGKGYAVLKEICQVLGVPKPLEIEKKYLVSGFNPASLPDPSQRVHIVQYYLKNEDSTVQQERIRLREHNGGQAYYHTLKQEVRPGVRTEIERPISREEYFEMLQRAHPNLGKIDKDRICFVYKNQYFELDLFKGLGLILLELELTDENKEVYLPDFLAPYVRDVTGDKEFSNFEIARRIGR